MIILGIDPGTRRVGYGVIKKDSGKISFVEAGLLEVSGSDKVGHVALGYLKEIKDEVERIVKKFHPEILAIEQLYFSKNQKTAISVAQARGVVLLAALENNIRIEEYGPNEVKAGITGYGMADKKAVLKMVKLTLGKQDLDVIDDASDALAVAIIAGQRLRG